MSTLIALPPEIMHNVLSNVEPQDLATLSRCCRALHKFISGNRQLFKELYLQRLDDPPRSSESVEPNWEEGLHKLVRLKTILECRQSEKKEKYFSTAATTLISFLQTANPDEKPPRTIPFLTALTSTPTAHDLLLCNSTLFARVSASTSTNLSPCEPLHLSSADRQLSAKLHVLYGIPILHAPAPASVTRRRRSTISSRTYPYACSTVYDLRNYTERTRWGPWIDEDGEDGDGEGSLRVDWEKVEAIMVVVGHNLRLFAGRSGRASASLKGVWARAWEGAVRGSYASIAVGRVGEIEPPVVGIGDPFGVTGTYIRAVCFLDFTELFAYNFASEPPPDGEPRPPLDTIEAIRIILMELQTTKIEAPGKDDNPNYPVVHYKGTSRSTHEPWDPNANSNIRGTVRMTREGEVRWTSISVFQGEERWRSEGVQVGGIRSARGVLGHWFDKNYDIHGPAGPSGFWKISDEIQVEHDDLLDMLPM